MILTEQTPDKVVEGVLIKYGLVKNALEASIQHRTFLDVFRGEYEIRTENGMLFVGPVLKYMGLDKLLHNEEDL